MDLLRIHPSPAVYIADWPRSRNKQLTETGRSMRKPGQLKDPEKILRRRGSLSGTELEL